MKNSPPQGTNAKVWTVATGWLAGVPSWVHGRVSRLSVVALLTIALALSVSEEADAVVQPRPVISRAQADSAALAWVRHRQLVAAFAEFGASEVRTAPVVAAVERQAARFGVDPLLVVAVISLENPDLNPRSVSSAGATGIMQVMPQWIRSFRERCGHDLTNVDTNVCFGVNVLQLHIDDARGSVQRGLLAYVGCVKDIACRSYPDAVMRRWRDAAAIAD